MTEGRKPGRPRTGRTREHEVHAYLDAEEAQWVEALKRKWRLGTSATVRRALLEAVEREGLR